MAPLWLDTPNYSEFDTSFPVSDHIHNVGYGFSNGLFGGSMYHFMKGFSLRNATIPSKLLAGVYAARANSLRTAGMFGLFTLVIDASYYAAFKHHGKIDVKDHTVAWATTGAIMWAPRGLRSASCASILLGAIPLAYAAFYNAVVRHSLYSEAHSPNPYSYSHYHLHRHPGINIID